MKTKRPFIFISIILVFVLACQTLLTGSGTDVPIATPDVLSAPTVTAAPTEGIEDAVLEAPPADMVLVPEGEFIMGSSFGYPDEGPEHKVYLDSFSIDKYEVTNAQYGICVAAGVCLPPTDLGLRDREVYYGNPEFDNYPVVNVEWEMAKTYCEWRGAQLPTEAQWEKAARGTDARLYSWGNEIDQTFANYNVNLGNTTPVGAYESGVSPYGAYDMTGNVEEWVADWYAAEYYANSPSSNPLGPETSDRKVSRGGSWSSDYDFSRTTFRFKGDPTYASVSLGFRCASGSAPATDNAGANPTLPSSQPDCSTDVIITEKDTPKGIYLEVCANGSTSEIGPLAKGAFAVGPNKKFFVYCANNGLVYAVKVGDTRLQPIGDVKDFSAIIRDDVPVFEIEFMGEGPYKVTIREVKYKQNSTFSIPRSISEP
ncbi:formylglycine-generating enzyme family protein [Candidatus Villigracilis affinis]|uniref:formylglycine-generating enzyme family protein n=1 Tax=Candidatus Villigracilis affinis TaxID=3140682 RepID=UPI002A2205DF|nr:formylglycine-generating enzyme family protein [Anaerolineales bacterium]